MTWVLNPIEMKLIVLITLVNLIWTRRKIRFDQLLLNLAYGNQEQPFTKPDQENIYMDTRDQVPDSMFLWV